MSRSEIRESILIAIDGVRSRKMRSFLTVLGVVIGVTSVIAVASIIDGLNRNIVQRVQALGAKTFFVSRLPAVRLGHIPEQYWIRKYLQPEDAEAIRANWPTVEIASIFLTRASFTGEANVVRYETRSSTTRSCAG